MPEKQKMEEKWYYKSQVYKLTIYANLLMAICSHFKSCNRHIIDSCMMEPYICVGSLTSALILILPL